MKKAFVVCLTVSILLSQASLALAGGRRRAYTRTGSFNVCVAKSGSAIAVGNASSTVVVSGGGTATVVNCCKVSATSGNATAVQNCSTSTESGQNVVVVTPDDCQTGGCNVQASSEGACAQQGP